MLELEISNNNVINLCEKIILIHNSCSFLFEAIVDHTLTWLQIFCFFFRKVKTKH